MNAGTIHISAIDVAVIVVYLVGIVSFGLWAGLRQRRRNQTGEGYFLAGKSLTWPVIGLALFATNIQTTHLVGMAQEGYMSGMVFGNLEWLAAFLLIVSALFFVPFYIRSRVSTLPDFLEKRYSRPCRDWLAVIGIISAVFFHIGMALYSGGTLLRNLIGVPMHVSIPLLSLLTLVYTIIGGLSAVVMTETVQAVIMIVGSAMLVGFGLVKLGGWSQMVSHVDPVMMTICRGPDDPSGMPWYAAFLGYPVLGLWYWCADQTIVQRVLGAKDENHARVGTLFCGFLKILPVFLFTLPGIILMAMVSKGLCPPLANSADTYGYLVQNLLPVGFKGLMAAAMLAAMTSCVAGALNSSSVLFTYDVYLRLRPEKAGANLVRFGRWVTAGMLLVGILWTPIIAQFPSIMRYVLAVVCHISPPITAVFLWGVFWRKASAKGALATFRLGFFLGLISFLLTVFKPYTHWPIAPLMSCFYLFLICTAIHFVVSLRHPHQHNEESSKLVWDSPMQALENPGWRGIGNYKFLAALLAVVMVCLYVYFK